MEVEKENELIKNLEVMKEEAKKKFESTHAVNFYDAYEYYADEVPYPEEDRVYEATVTIYYKYNYIPGHFGGPEEPPEGAEFNVEFDGVTVYPGDASYLDKNNKVVYPTDSVELDRLADFIVDWKQDAVIDEIEEYIKEGMD